MELFRTNTNKRANYLWNNTKRGGICSRIIRRYYNPDIFKTFSKTHSTAFENFPRGDPTKLGQTGLGMNPNTKIPDEYVDNLMKQIHFMKLELNLLQQKQDEDGGGGGIESLLQNDKRNHTDHVIMTADKFKDFTTKNK